ncbi:MAG: hypothetical protein NTX07_02245 [Solirubrobacterales bacterium]|nr:hypothetical protein [Solirubrobacterales bacterium]
MSQAPDSSLSPRLSDAALLGALHGPAELVPISSSGQITLFAFLAGLPYSEVPSEKRKSVEVALHAGTALALALFPPREGTSGPKGLQGVVFRAAMLAPTAAAGLIARRMVRENLGTPMSVSAGLAAGSGVMILAESRCGSRTASEAGVGDALVMGTAQALALWPGVSRSAMSTSSARFLGFSPGSSARLARAGLVPTSLAASTLEVAALLKEGIRSDEIPPIAAGAATAFISAIVSRPLATRMEKSGRLWPWALLRLMVAGAAIRRIRSVRDDGVR